MEVLSVRPGDVVVITNNGKIPSEAAKEEIKKILFKNIGFETSVMFKTPDINFSVIRPEFPKKDELVESEIEAVKVHTLLYLNENNNASMHLEDTYFNSNTPVLAGIDGYPVYYDGNRDFLSIKKAMLKNGRLYVTESDPEIKGLGGKVKRIELPLGETNASIEVVDGEFNG